MGRPTLKDEPMTAAERQARRRARLRKDKLALGAKAERQRSRIKSAEKYIPMPPGVTVWRKDGDKFQPVTKPLAGCHVRELDDDEVATLLLLLAREAQRRGLNLEAESEAVVARMRGAITALQRPSVLAAGDTPLPAANETVTVGAY